MSRRQILFAIILTVLVAVILSAIVVTAIDEVNVKIEQDCFNKLEDTSKMLANEIRITIYADRTILNAMADIIAGMEDYSTEKLSEVLHTYRFDDSFISYTSLLLPNNTMLYPDGSVQDASGVLNFTEEANKGAYISNRVQSLLDDNEMVIRHAVPVVKNGSTIYMLYAVIRLSDLAEKYKTDIYNGQAYVFIVSGDSGNFLLDTWHKTLGNIQDYTDRTPEPGYSWETFLSDLKAGRSGRLAMISETIGEVVYIKYDPIGVNNGSVMVMVPKPVALGESEAFIRHLYHKAIIVGAVMLLYMLGVTLSLLYAYKKMRKLSNEDQTTGLKNRNAYECYMADIQNRIFACLTCVFMDVNGLHEINNKHGHKVGDQMLKTVANELLLEFPYRQVFRIGGDEFVVISDEYDADACTEKMERIARQVASYNYSISYGIAHDKNVIGADIIVQEADERMLESKRAYYAENNRYR